MMRVQSSTMKCETECYDKTTLFCHPIYLCPWLWSNLQMYVFFLLWYRNHEYDKREKNWCVALNISMYYRLLIQYQFSWGFFVGFFLSKDFGFRTGFIYRTGWRWSLYLNSDDIEPIYRWRAYQQEHGPWQYKSQWAEELYFPKTSKWRVRQWI